MALRAWEERAVGVTSKGLLLMGMCLFWSQWGQLYNLVNMLKATELYTL